MAGDPNGTQKIYVKCYLQTGPGYPVSGQLRVSFAVPGPTPPPVTLRHSNGQLYEGYVTLPQAPPKKSVPGTMYCEGPEFGTYNGPIKYSSDTKEVDVIGMGKAQRRTVQLSNTSKVSGEDTHGVDASDSLDVKKTQDGSWELVINGQAQAKFNLKGLWENPASGEVGKAASEALAIPTDGLSLLVGGIKSLEGAFEGMFGIDGHRTVKNEKRIEGSAAEVFKISRVFKIVIENSTTTSEKQAHIIHTGLGDIYQVQDPGQLNDQMVNQLRRRFYSKHKS